VQKNTPHFGPTWGQLPIFSFSLILILVDGVRDGGFTDYFLGALESALA
jgi:hypothetical protein